MRGTVQIGLGVGVRVQIGLGVGVRVQMCNERPVRSYWRNLMYCTSRRHHAEAQQQIYVHIYI